MTKPLGLRMGMSKTMKETGFGGGKPESLLGHSIKMYEICSHFCLNVKCKMPTNGYLS